MTRQIKWDVSKRDAEVIDRIADRAAKLAAGLGIKWTKQDFSMDITATHLNGRPLDLKRLLAAPEFEFSHDVFGIRRFLNRTTGQIDAAQFNPRFSMPIGAAHK